MGGTAQPRAWPLQLGNVQLHGEALMDQWEAKSGNVLDFMDRDRTPLYKGEEVIDPAKIVDLTSQVDAGGHLE